MIDLWPEEDSSISRLRSVFDEAIRPPKTGQEIVDDLLECASALRAAGEPLPRVLEQLERQEVLDRFMSSDPSCSWLRERRPLGRIEEVIEHWRGCITCQALGLRDRQARHERGARGRKYENGLL